ncbi:MAG: discoidin domain-containing protein [Bacteroidales bacterium]|jgi:hypothetical protein|nr:discoidin domain-containing protein [Bacteroidales bacterium]
MNKINKIYYSIFISIACFMASCGDMDENYKEFIVSNGITYPGKVVSPLLHPGENRILLEWQPSNDPKVTNTRIYWNNYTDSIDIPTLEDMDTLYQMISPLVENTYTFIFKTFDDERNSSVPMEITGKAYGDIYRADLSNRRIANEYVDEERLWTIIWGKSDILNGAAGTELIYKISDTETRRVVVPADEDILRVTGHVSESEYKYRTFFLPTPIAIDTFYTAYDTGNVPVKNPVKISTDGWIATADTWAPNQGQTENGSEGGIPAKTIDGNPATFWHTATDAQGQPAGGSYPTNYPHWLAYDMGENIDVYMVELTPRGSYTQHGIKEFQIQGSMDGSNWTTYDIFTGTTAPANKATLEQRAVVQQFYVDGTPTMKYIRIWMLNSHANQQHGHLAEFAVYKE